MIAIRQVKRQDWWPAKGTDRQVQMLRQLAADKDRSSDEICQTMGIRRTTYYHYVKTKETD